MGSAHPPTDSWFKPYKPLIIVGIVLIVLLVLLFPVRKHFYDQPPVPSKPQITQIDPLCEYVSGSLRLKCLVGPAGEGVFGPGRYVDYDSSANQKVPFTRGSLFLSPCLLPGAQSSDLLSDLQNQEQTNEVGFDNITYTLNRGFSAGAQLPIPKLDNLIIKAGPRLSEIQTITLSAPHAWIKIVDENKFIDLLSRAAITQECIDDIVDNKYSVISEAAIAKDYAITITDKSGHSMDLSAAATSGHVTIDAGGAASADIDQTIKKISATPLVVAVDFFPTRIFSQNREKLVSPIFKPTGTTTVALKASGQGGINWQREHSGPIGVPLNVSEQGATGSVCGGCRPAVAQLDSMVTPLPQAKGYGPKQVFEFSTRGVLGGGESRNLTGLLAQSSIEADVSYQTTVETIVKSRDSSILGVTLPSLYNVSIRVFDWTGKPLREKDRSGNTIDFGIPGPGIYRTEVSARGSLKSEGAEPRPVNSTSQFAITVR